MSRVAFWLVCLAMLSVTGNSQAALGVSGEVMIDPPPATLLRGATATITYTLTNTGDEPLDSGLSRLIYSVITPVGYGPGSTLIPSPTGATPPCGFYTDAFEPPPVGPVILINWISFNPFPILPGESRQCVTNLLVSPEAEGPFVQQFTFIARRGDQSVFMSRNIRFGLGEQPALIPANSSGSLLLLVVLILAVSVYRRLR